VSLMKLICSIFPGRCASDAPEVVKTNNSSAEQEASDSRGTSTQERPRPSAAKTTASRNS
jgi:hypothetical protein